MLEKTEIKYEVATDIVEIGDALEFLAKAIREKMSVAEIIAQYAIVTKALEGLDDAKLALQGEELINSAQYLGNSLLRIFLKKK